MSFSCEEEYLDALSAEGEAQADYELRMPGIQEWRETLDRLAWSQTALKWFLDIMDAKPKGEYLTIAELGACLAAIRGAYDGNTSHLEKWQR